MRPCRDGARYGVQHSIEALTASKIECSEEDCWRFTALARHLGDAQGAYRGPTGGPYVFYLWRGDSDANPVSGGYRRSQSCRSTEPRRSLPASRFPVSSDAWQ
jgi:hypothetical protein